MRRRLSVDAIRPIRIDDIEKSKSFTLFFCVSGSWANGCDTFSGGIGTGSQPVRSFIVEIIVMQNTISGLKGYELRT